jgi:molybdopterin-binding protein
MSPRYHHLHEPIAVGRSSRATGGAQVKLSARNVIKGTVKMVTPGVVNTEVVVEIADGTEVVSIITKSSAERLGLAVGKPVYVVIKASNVMLAVD